MKKKIIIFTSSGGGGHTAATQALIAYLGSTYDIIYRDMFVDVLKLYIIPKKYTCNDLYNDALKRGHILFINILKYMCRFIFILIHPLNVWLIKRAIAPHNPDALISVIPLSNKATLAVAKELNIPFFLIPTDFDPRAYFYEIKKATYEKFYIARVIDDPKIDAYIYATGIRRSNVLNTGFIIRPEFFTPKDPIELKKKFHIPEKVPVVMIMLGAAGSVNMYKIARELHKLNMPCHFIFCAGRHSGILSKINSLKLPSYVSLTVLGFTQEIAELLSTADIYVTKPGPNSISEALQMNVPMIIATFGRILSWEKYNVNYVVQQSYGVRADSVHDIYREIKHLLESPKELASLREHLQIRKRENLQNNLLDALAHIMR